MPISDWFRSREEHRYTLSKQPEGGSAKAHGAWAKCDECGHILFEGELASTVGVCPKCDHHGRLGARRRIEMLADDDSFVESWGDLRSGDPLAFDAGKPYAAGLEDAREKTGLDEAVAVGRASIDSHAVMLGAMDFGFVGGSMGSVVGEKIVRAFDRAAADGLPVVLAIASGGARMQEGMLSLMQMARTADAARRFSERRVSGRALPYVAILTHPTTGGVTASFAALADVTLAEPGALIGFAGPRVIEQTVREKLPKGFQSAEAVMSQGFVDEVVHRTELRDRVATVLGHLGGHLAGGAR